MYACIAVGEAVRQAILVKIRLIQVYTAHIRVNIFVYWSIRLDKSVYARLT